MRRGQGLGEARQLLRVGSVVRLEPDRGETDRYGRTLRYLWTAEGRLYPALMVRQGLGLTLVVPLNQRYQALLRSAEEQAWSERDGGWRDCGWVD